MKSTVLAIAVLLAPLAAWADTGPGQMVEPTAADARSCPFAAALAERYGISFSGFQTAIPASHPPDSSTDGPFVEIRIPEAVPVSDGFHHVALVSRKLQKAWIRRTGGFVGVYEWYGPVDADTSLLEPCLGSRLRGKAASLR